MYKLPHFTDISIVNIRDGIDKLSNVVKSIDISLKDIGDHTDSIILLMRKNQDVLQSRRFDSVLSEVESLREFLYERCMDLFEMGKEIIDYQELLYSFEELPFNNEWIKQPDFSESIIILNSDNKNIIIDKDVLIKLTEDLDKYSDSIDSEISLILSETDDIRTWWNDPQYDIFSTFTKDLCDEIKMRLSSFEDYNKDLKKSIGVL